MRRQRNIPLIVASVLCAVSLITMISTLVFTQKDQEPQTFVPPLFEEQAIRGIPEVPSNLGWSELDAQVYKASVCGVVTVTDGKADVWFTNPESNDVWLKLRVLDGDGNILGETGLIRPGEYVRAVSFKTIPKPGDAIGLKLMAYEPETYYSAGSAILNTVVAGGT